MERTASALVKDRADFAHLLTELRKRISDRQAESDGFQIYYGIDSDVVTLITSPWDQGSRNPFDELFTDDLTAQDAFCYLFAEHAYRSFNERPFLLVSPSENELDGLWNDVYRDAQIEFDESEDIEVALSSERISELDEREIYAKLRRIVGVIHGADSAISHLRRINRLAHEGILRRMESITDSLGGYPFPILSPDEERELSKSTARWSAALNSSRPSRPGSNAIDGAVLAKIEITNTALQQRKQKTRLCFVTGDRHIRRIAANTPAESGQSFDYCYIRSPVAFLIDRNFFQVGGVEEPAPVERLSTTPSAFRNIGISDWFLSLLDLEMSSALDRISRTNLARQLIEVRGRWTEFLRSSGAKVQISKEEINLAVETNIKAARFLDRPEVKSDFERLRSRFVLIRREAAKGFAASAALARFWSLDSTSNHKNGRGVPGVRFDSFKNAAEMAAQLSASNGLQNARLTLRRDWVAELRREDKSGYTVLVIIALAFAYAGEWRVALTVVTWAHSLALREKAFDGLSTVKGDEAAYLCAVFSRLSAESVSDLSNAEDWLREAKKLLNESPVRKQLSDSKVPPPYTDPRFESEGLAIQVTRLMFSKFSGESKSALSANSQLELMQLANLSAAHLALLQQPAMKLPAHILEYVRNQLMTNFLQIEVLKWIAGETTDEVTTNASALIDRYVSLEVGERLLGDIDEFGDRSKSDLISFVLLCSVLLLCPKRIQGAETLYIQSAKRHAALLKTMPYDAARASAFLAAVATIQS